MAEFGSAGNSASLVREISQDETIYAKDKITHARLLIVPRRVILTDSVNGRGERTVSNGDQRQLKGFNFNEIPASGGKPCAPLVR